MITNGMTFEQELERYKRWLEDRNIELKETKKHLKIVSELLKIHKRIGRSEMKKGTRRVKFLDIISEYFDNGDNIFPKPMSDYEFKRIITDYLLGKDWYIANPVSDAQANVYIAAEIIERYRRRNY